MTSKLPLSTSDRFRSRDTFTASSAGTLVAVRRRDTRNLRANSCKELLDAKVACQPGLLCPNARHQHFTLIAHSDSKHLAKP